jgi:hypothetical protein
VKGGAVALIVAAVLCAKVTQAEEAAPKVAFSGQVRPRFEVQDFRDGLSADTFTSMRTRMGMTGQPAEGVKVFAQVQDVRLWGEETHTSTDYRADNFDLHQGYFELLKMGGKPLSLRAGRQELTFAEERLVGASNWAPQGRAFDGVRATAAGKGGSLDLFLMKLREDSSPGRPPNSTFGGAYARITGAKGQVVDLYALYDRVAGAGGVDRLTAGFYWSGERGRVDYRVEFAHQAGDLAGSGINANLLGATAGVSFGRQVTGKVALWYDYLSGDSSGRASRVFNTLFGTNHKFYGFADYFTNMSLDTRNFGLQDAALKVSVKPEQRVTLGMDVHGFWTAAKLPRAGIPGILRPLPANDRFGQEVDLTVTLVYRKAVTLTAGYSHFFVDDAMTFLRGLRGDGNFAYVMTNVSF